MGGLARICKMYGGMNIQGVEWVWDYDNDIARVKSEMTKDEIDKSEKAKWTLIKNKINETKEKRNLGF